MISPPPSRRPPYLSGSLALAIALGAGCSGHTPPKADEAQVRQFSGKGYQSDDQYGVATSYASWLPGGMSQELALTVPAKPGLYPLVIYLPGLGESRTAGEAWRTAWARAGYAVLAVQPMAADMDAWSSSRARSADFGALARERYGPQAISARIEALGKILLELQRRRAAGEASLDRIDLSRVALAGFDLGALTATAAAGEDLGGTAMPPLPVTLRAVIALSPYGGFSGPAFEDRYRGIRVPVLSVTSDADADPLGLVTSPHVRQAPFQYMPAGGKYLAVLNGLPHAAFGDAGSDTGDQVEPNGGSPDDVRGSQESGHRRGGGQRSRERGDNGGRGSGPGLEPRLSATARALGIAAIQGISTAFLDAMVKDDDFAREWLDKDATRWLRGQGTLKRK